MSDGPKWDAEKVRPVAEKLVQQLGPGCERIEIAGSLRRGKKLVSDIELVLIERFEEKPGDGLFGGTVRVSALRPIIDQLVRDGRVVTVMDGPSMKKLRIATVKSPLHVDLFIVSPAGWGYQLTIRTGPAPFSARTVTQRYKGGLLADGYLCSGGQVWKLRGDLAPPQDGSAPPPPFALFDGSVYEAYPVPEESDFMALLSCGLVEPQNRSRV